jgi:hypothetical protein
MNFCVCAASASDFDTIFVREKEGQFEHKWKDSLALARNVKRRNLVLPFSYALFVFRSGMSCNYINNN